MTLMKRFSIILFGALAIVMASCSKNIEPASPDSDDWYHDVSLPVPIEFAESSVLTKAAIETLADLDRPLGVFAVDKSATDLNINNILLNNVPAHCEPGVSGSNTIKFGTIDSSYDLYYPMVSNVSYSFYAYYAYNGSATLPDAQTTATHVKIPVSVSTSTSDILWAESYAEKRNGYDGFNAAYIRKVGIRPHFNFKHVTSKVYFRAGVFYDEASEIDGLENLSVKSLWLLNVPTRANLCVIGLGADAKDKGKLVDLSAYDKARVLKELKLLPVNQTNPNSNQYQYEVLGNPIFLAPNDEPLTIEMTLSFTLDGSPREQVVTYTLDPKSLGAATEDENGTPLRRFEAGYKYGFNIKVYSPMEIKIEATVEDYKEAFEDEYADVDIM